jgi:hypothetical protein
MRGKFTSPFARRGKLFCQHLSPPSERTMSPRLQLKSLAHLPQLRKAAPIWSLIQRGAKAYENRA